MRALLAAAMLVFACMWVLAVFAAPAHSEPFVDPTVELTPAVQWCDVPGAPEVALDQANGFAQNVLDLGDGQTCPRGEPYPILDERAAYAQAARDLAAEVWPAASLPDRIQTRAAAWGNPPALLLAIARCESGLDPGAVNRRSGSAGLYQFVRGTWAGTPQGHAGLSPLNADAAIEGANWLFAREGARPWLASRACWSRG